MMIQAATSETLPYAESETLLKDAPLYQIILFDDDEHTYAYVIEMMMNVFIMSVEDAHQVAYDVDYIGQAVVKTCPLEEAVTGRDSILSYGSDFRSEHSSGSMKAIIQKVSE